MGLVVTNKNLPSAKAKSVVEVEVFTGTEFFGHKTEIIQDHTRLTNLNGDQEVQHINAKEKVAVQGITNKAFGYKFDGVNDRVVVNHNDLFNTTSNGFTIELLFKLTQQVSQKILLSKVDAGADAMVLSIESGNTVAFKLTIGGVAYLLNASLPPVGKDCHVIFSYVNRKMLIYINGELSNKLDVNTDLMLNIASAMYIGGIGGYEYNGNISIVRFYKRGFDQLDVDYYYNAGRPDLTRLSYADKVNKTSTGCVLELLPENATASKWLETQNGLDGVTIGAPSINYGNCTPEQYVAPFKKYIGLERNGDGTGSSKFRIITNKTGKAIIYGGEFVNSTNTSSLGSELDIIKGTENDVYVRLTSSTALIEVDNVISFIWGSRSSTLNSPIPRMNINEIPDEFSATISSAAGLYGRVADIPRTVSKLLIASTSDIRYLTGDYIDLPRGLKTLQLYRTNISGNFKDLPKTITDVLYLQETPSSSNISGLIADLPPAKRFEISGYASVGGDLNGINWLPSLILLTSSSINVTYSNGIKVNPAFESIRIRPSVGVFTSAMTDSLLIDLAAQIISSIGAKTIDLSGNCGAPTAASSEARAKLSGLGFTIIVN